MQGCRELCGRRIDLPRRDGAGGAPTERSRDAEDEAIESALHGRALLLQCRLCCRARRLRL